MIESPEFSVAKDAYFDLQGLNKLRGAKSKDDKTAALREAADQFESIFVNNLMKSMRKANEVMKSDMFASNSIEYYQEMFDQQVAVQISQQGGIGVAESLLRQIEGGVAKRPSNRG